MFDAGKTLMYGGLDLAAGGKDFSTLVLAEQYEIPTGHRGHWIHQSGVWEETAAHYVITGIHRWPQGTDPGDVLAQAADIFDHPALDHARLRYDATGLGAGVRSIVRDLHSRGRFPAGYSAVTITGGQQSEHGTPKLDLVSTLGRLLHERRLHVLDGPLVKQWKTEMNAFQAKVTAAGNVRYEAQTEAIHDDLVMATALAVNKRLGGARSVQRQYFEQTILTGEE